MNSLNAEVRRPTVSLPFYYGWVNVFVAALAMVGTLPGRTQGLGLITEPLLRDLQIDRVLFARINLWATLIGALFCLGVGRLIDRFGSRVVFYLSSKPGDRSSHCACGEFPRWLARISLEHEPPADSVDDLARWIVTVTATCQN
jgi:hypothetical protein